MPDSREQWVTLLTPAILRRVVPMLGRKEEKQEISTTPAVRNVLVIQSGPNRRGVLGRSSILAMLLRLAEPLEQGTTLLDSLRLI